MSPIKTRTGSMIVPASTRGEMRYLNGLTDNVVIASICSVTRIVPISAAIAETGAPLTERSIQKHLYTADLPDVDLFVRSSGEQRTSNFLLWQSAYAEMVFLDRLWPDFTRADLWEAVTDFVGRDRRFGGAIDKPTT